MSAPDLNAAASAVDLARDVVRQGLAHLATTGSVDADQVIAYDLAHAAAAVETARTLLDYGAKGDTEAKITCAFVADAVADVATKVYGREAAWGVDPTALDDARAFVAAYRDPAFLASIDGAGPRHLDDDFELVQDTFR
ncbi:MAG: acyl-CoA dehydrogenase family protein, partial [Acidimicrobiales bacterium]